MKAAQAIIQKRDNELKALHASIRKDEELVKAAQATIQDWRTSLQTNKNMIGKYEVERSRCESLWEELGDDMVARNMLEMMYRDASVEHQQQLCRIESLLSTYEEEYAIRKGEQTSKLKVEKPRVALLTAAELSHRGPRIVPGLAERNRAETGLKARIAQVEARERRVKEREEQLHRQSQPNTPHLDKRKETMPALPCHETTKRFRSGHSPNAMTEIQVCDVEEGPVSADEGFQRQLGDSALLGRLLKDIQARHGDGLVNDPDSMIRDTSKAVAQVFDPIENRVYNRLYLGTCGRLQFS